MRPVIVALHINVVLWLSFTSLTVEPKIFAGLKWPSQSWRSGGGDQKKMKK